MYRCGDINFDKILTIDELYDIMIFMKVRLYSESQVNNLMNKMGDAFDYAINDCKIAGADFVKIFAASTVCKKIENGDVSYTAGKSGIEIAIESINEITGKKLCVTPRERYERTAEYWCGWATYYYQWWSSRKYADIFRAVSFEEIMSLYPMLHEASEEKFVEIIDDKMRRVYPDTNLKRIRTTYGCSQRELAKMSGVSLRSIQMYEQHNKNINKAQVGAVYCLAKALGCTMEDLLEN